MTVAASPRRELFREIKQSASAPDIAAAAALLEIGDRLGVLEEISTGGKFTASRLASIGELPESGVARYLEALESAGIIERVDTDGDFFRTVSDYDVIRHQAGYVSWTMNANRPFVEHPREFLIDPESARAAYVRDGRQVAVSSQWMGSLAFYPAAFEAITEARPTRVADLGSGTCRLLIELLDMLPGTTGLGLDLDQGACDAAKDAAAHAGMSDRLTVLQRSIQSLATDPGPLLDADVIHAGFVFHDMLPDEEHIADAVLANCHTALRPGGLMAITEAIPYVRTERERRFSSIVTYYHREFMTRKLLSVAEWEHKLSGAGFRHVETVELGFPTGRLFLARK
ncbi:methyltransferase type 12 [Amycolatopsis mediterranei S699]|uniref:Methyltransferase type 12 n=2 Tax=Amycolatopsis mediterranei TaxID=33910 RepID=A0A0H3D6B1_AMYMU|nr:methyltransferase [Amycolatopsis mediterranei]ADJ46540.1 methyltransferase type 12 [Amycolatopsis mediterranei U32]AEK43340.1 methyltransferase type 12 [Amycolatopsis mediterranei S699]AFO78251.1 methyltransferase type 12 [Amycolatopsis mediterranei S699]AGT85379.1 methyltransferase type 12 [Amycolatopsis mediterranei RB]KDO06197.1 methyltransferase type 12 [Amycolatopsis mediterranei]